MALHALAERVTIARLGEWEVRRDDEAGERHRYFAPRGMLHLQLWHPIARISVLTPSALTGGRYDICRAGIRIAVSTWEEVTAHLDGEQLPGLVELAVLHLWTVVRDEASARRGRIPIAPTVRGL